MLTSKQRAYLRGLANTEDAIIQIGKENVTDGTVSLVDEALKARELVKIRVLKTASDDAKDIAQTLVARLPGTEIIHVLGRVIVLFRFNVEKPQIILP
ncbi:MAG: YhbY family RNA-binding protein [Firmicutes bacterium]|nr:YhbY family RNA-binding protein [Bacillota bacterium]MDD4263361.1 YhbY family RNA-binding protein [Bacillota bacterium]MDD4693383.1 YhbY family RNA-binding protein [Bacillota bacterium]